MSKPIVHPIYTTKKERLDAARRMATSINKKQGFECITTASYLSENTFAPFDVPEIDSKIGGGIVHGAFTVLWGGEASGKSTLALKLAAKAQKDGKIVAWAALEKLDKQRAIQFGVNIDELQLLQFPKAEGVLDALIAYARDKIVDVFILDSIHNLSPKKIQEDKHGIKSLEDNNMAVLPLKLAEFFPIASDPVKRSNMAVLLIGQTRKVGLGTVIVLDGLTGGHALKHGSRMTIHIRRGAKDDSPIKTIEVDGKKTDKIIGFPCVLKLDKVQVTGSQPEQTLINIPFYFESGFDLPADLKAIAAAEEAEINAQEAPEFTEEEISRAESDNTEKDEIKVHVAPGNIPKKRGRKPGIKNKPKE